MSAMELLLTVALLGAGAVARYQALLSPPVELLENLELLEDLPLVEDAGEEP